ncbi:MAG: YfiR family protein [Alphaproteobacteria bacterium]|nr:YfiR family protein [Alphaproteobacteria bacterium]
MLAALWWLHPSQPALADSESRLENAIKAGFLFNFARFTTFDTRLPASTDFSFCVDLNAIDPEAFSDWENETLDGRMVAVRFTGAMPPILPGLACDVLYLGKQSVASLSELIGLRADGSTPLLVAETEGFARSGGHIELYREGRNLRFRINIGQMRRDGLNISAQVLKLAQIVETDESAEGGRGD